MLRAAGIDLVCAQGDEHLLLPFRPRAGFLAAATSTTIGHASLYPAPNDLPARWSSPSTTSRTRSRARRGCRKPRAYGSEWSSAATLLKSIDAGIGVETDAAATVAPRVRADAPDVHRDA